jgi:hypothetical protein
MHTDDFRFKHYSLSCDQLTMLIPWDARLLHTYHNVHQGEDGFSAIVLEPWGRILKADDYKAVLLGTPVNIIATKRLRHPAFFDQPWHRSSYPLNSGSNVFRMSPAAVIADVICGHLVVEEPDCDLPRIEREFLLVGHGAYISEKQFARLEYVGCWTGNNGAKVLLEIFEVRPGA